MTPGPIITLDGPAGTGKSTIAAALAQSMGWSYYNTGALYRCLCGWMLERGWLHLQAGTLSLENENDLADLRMEVSHSAPYSYFIEGQDVTPFAKDQTIALLVSKFSAWPCIRAYLLHIQRNLGQRGHCVFEGRDMGTTVFPYAQLKIFLTANAYVRAQRRFEQLLAEGSTQHTLDEILQQIQLRDSQDEQREMSPLKCADDAVIIDSSDLDIQQVIDKILQLCQSRQLY